jgi:hypothetical protein
MDAMNAELRSRWPTFCVLRTQTKPLLDKENSTFEIRKHTHPYTPPPKIEHMTQFSEAMPKSIKFAWKTVFGKF